MNDQIQQLVANAQRIVIIQADNPDADSLASSLALETLLHDMGKEAFMFCGIDMPEYLKYLSGWDRVSKEIPAQFDATIIVDTSARSLLQKLEESDYRNWVAKRPVLVLDHHAGVECDIPYATVILNNSGCVSTGEVIFSVASQLGWPLSLAAKEFIATSILADSMGLTSDNTTPTTYRVMAELVEGGVDRPKLEEQRRAFTKMPEVILRYKARLIDRTELHDGGRIAVVIIPQDEINEFSPLYNPGPLIQNDLLQTQGVVTTVVLKHYDSGRITAAIRCNTKAPIASELAQHFSGGGHAYAAGFKLEDGRPLSEIKSECLRYATELLEKLNLKDTHNETIQHTFS